MKLDDNGTAFFVEDVNSESEDEDIPPELATSPIPTSQSYMEMARPKFPKSDVGSGGEGKEGKKANRSLIGEFNTIEEKESSAAEKEDDDDNVSELTYMYLKWIWKKNQLYNNWSFLCIHAI